jgi:DNA-binding NarL/FixJ family response regulator
MSITILLADDHDLVRQGLRAILEAVADFSVVGEAADGVEAVRQAERLRPDVVIADLFMPGLNGAEVVRLIAKRAPATRSLVLSIESETSNVREALTNGAAGYVGKDAPATELIQAIRAVVAGKRYLNPGMSEAVLSSYVKNSLADDAPDAYETLTDREREVFYLVIKGTTSANIAKQLFISPRTVEIHRSSMMRKLRLKGTMDLILYAVRRGFVSAHRLTDKAPGIRKAPRRKTSARKPKARPRKHHR